ncbi:hypothetical protein SKAU_G00397900 [Synaphobranchus kaupii]|uniref:Uncharacterized protein n=1 Tax=Synaphobranchus kaupii TaxID=118154 RepID=A0A9Q1E8F7_SYNKA|nr:hypothetical protein SKAU_G00397900 [Synaphobranchus kaupii]
MEAYIHDSLASGARNPCPSGSPKRINCLSRLRSAVFTPHQFHSWVSLWRRGGSEGILLRFKPSPTGPNRPHVSTYNSSWVLLIFIAALFAITALSRLHSQNLPPPQSLSIGVPRLNRHSTSSRPGSPRPPSSVIRTPIARGTKP